LIVPPFRLLLALLVVGAYAALLAALFSGAPPLWFVVTHLIALAATIHLGIFFLGLGVFVDVFVRGEKGSRSVALTFDDGPHPVHTRRVLDLLDAAGAKATFFVIGAKVDAHPEVVAEIVRRGHEVGLHSYTHDRLLFMRNESKIVADLVRTQDAVERAAGVRPRLFRPPVGFSSPRTRTAVRQLGLTVAGWSARAFDGAGRPSARVIVSRIARALEDGAVVLLHDASERGDAAPTSIDAIPELLGELKERGLAAVTVSTLMTGARPSVVVAQHAR
jgi:peptidoglycan/xylan/chitin deacetylase (PgdA/CDA1 family)